MKFYKGLLIISLTLYSLIGEKIFLPISIFVWGEFKLVLREYYGLYVFIFYEVYVDEILSFWFNKFVLEKLLFKRELLLSLNVFDFMIIWEEFTKFFWSI